VPNGLSRGCKFSAPDRCCKEPIGFLDAKLLASMWKWLTLFAMQAE
jgi:hypothetical protein